MSISPETNANSLGSDFIEATERALGSGNLGEVSDTELERVMTAAVRLFAAKAESENRMVRPITPEALTPTDIVVTVSALIRSGGLNLWDVSMWFNRTRP